MRETRKSSKHLFEHAIRSLQTTKDTRHFTVSKQYTLSPLYNKWFTDSKATLYFSQHPGSLLYMGLGSVLLMAMLLMAEQDLVLVADFFLPLEIDELHCNPSVKLMRCYYYYYFSFTT